VGRRAISTWAVWVRMHKKKTRGLQLKGGGEKLRSGGVSDFRKPREGRITGSSNTFRDLICAQDNPYPETPSQHYPPAWKTRGGVSKGSRAKDNLRHRKGPMVTKKR